MRFHISKTKILNIRVSLLPDAMGASGHFKLVRYVGTNRPVIGDSVTSGSSEHNFVFEPKDMEQWDAVNVLESDIFATFDGATKADVVIEVTQIDPKTKQLTVCPNADKPTAGKPAGYRSTLTTPNAYVPTGSFAVLFM